MEEIRLDLSQANFTPEEAEIYSSIVERSREMGTVVGVPWAPNVFEYLFNSGLSQSDFERIMQLSNIGFGDEE